MCPTLFVPSIYIGDEECAPHCLSPVYIYRRTKSVPTLFVPSIYIQENKECAHTICPLYIYRRIKSVPHTICPLYNTGEKIKECHFVPTLSYYIVFPWLHFQSVPLGIQLTCTLYRYMYKCICTCKVPTFCYIVLLNQ